MKSRSALALLLLSQAVLLLFLLQQFLPQEALSTGEESVELSQETKKNLPDDWVGRSLPPVTLQGMKGPLELNKISGPAVIEFVSTSCAYCQKMAPIFSRVMRLAPADFLVVGVGSESLSSMRRWHQKEVGRKMPGGYAVDASGEAARQLGLIGTPTTIFLDRRGRVQFFVAGQISEEELRRFLLRAIRGS